MKSLLRAASVTLSLPVKSFPAALAALLVLAPPVAAQSVAGRVIDAETGAAIPVAAVDLLRANGSRVTSAAAGEEGTFRIVAQRPGTYRLRASHIAYATSTTEEFRLERGQQLIVDVRLSISPIVLEPLTVTGRRRDVRNEATHEGFYMRHLVLPPIGSARAVSRNDPEMVNARNAGDVMVWLRPMFPTRRRFCTVVYMDGRVAIDPMQGGAFMALPQALLEGLEYYRYHYEAPFMLREIPGYLNPIDCFHYSVVALWSRTGYYGEPPELPPSTSRANVASSLYHLAGNGVPSVGAGIEASVHWPVTARLALGANIRRTTHTLPAAATSSAVTALHAPLYLTPPGPRPFSLWIGGIEARRTLPQSNGVWPVIAARVQLARRSFTLRSSSEADVDASVVSWGGGAGLTAGGEIVLKERFAVHAALGHDRLFFGPYRELEHRLNPTAAHWGGTSVRVGFGYALGR